MFLKEATPVARTYYYLLTEDGSQIGDVLKPAFNTFESVHKDDAEVFRFVRQADSAQFERARIAFDVRRIPAIVISDENHTFATDETGNPSIALDRGILERYVRRTEGTIDEKATQDAFYNLIADFHYIVQDENMLHLKRKLAMDRVGSFLRAAWDEIKDLVSVNVAT